MKSPVLGLLCGLALGCNTSTPPAPNEKTSTAPPVATTGDHALPPATNPPHDPENTATNVRDRSDAAKTPIDQNENQADINITADIRKQVVDTKMSVNAQNVKIITQDGKVTLRGPVATVEEKQKIEEIAAGVAGKDNVDSQLEVEKQ